MNYAKLILRFFATLLACLPTAHILGAGASPAGQKENHWATNWDRPVIANDLEGVSIESYFEYEKPSPAAEKPCCTAAPSCNECCSHKGDETDKKETYKIKVGDKFLIQIYGEPNTRRVVSVDPSGSISYLTFNSARVEGKTVGELRELIRNKLQNYYKDPLVVINPAVFSGEFYTIMGEVRKPGNRVIEGSPTVLTALCQAGGFTTRIFRNQTVDQADLDHSFLSRSGDFLPVDFNRLLKFGDMSQDLALKAGDYIYIAPQNLNRVYVLGEVFTPATVEFLDSLSLLEAITEVGGVAPFASSRVAVIRGSLCCPIRYLIDLNRIKKGCAGDFPLEPGDIVYVPTMQYSTAKEIFRAAVASFVSTLASIAGTSTFIAVHPHAGVTGVLSPVPIINTGAGTTFITTPSFGSAATSQSTNVAQ